MMTFLSIGLLFISLVLFVSFLVLFFIHRRNKIVLTIENNKLKSINDDLTQKLKPITDVEKEIDLKRKAFIYQKNNEIEKINNYLQEQKAALKTEIDKFNSYKEKTKENIQKQIEEEKKRIADQWSQATRIVASAKEEADTVKQKADEARKEAIDFSASVRKKALTEAERIAGEAWKARNNAKHYEKVAIAMKNTINGYGDEYLIPGHTILDSLAEEFSHKEAGVAFANEKKHSKMLVSHGSAATCDYVAPAQRNNAIHFVLDAFNGKVDSILGLVKKDNYGKLDQMLKDAFHLVNKNGMVFRNARISHEYLESRRQELKWAVAVVELKAQEVEEQKKIRQIMRDEERARKEYEKAIKDAQKEESLLKDAMDKARKELETASEEQRLKYEKELSELQQKLIEAEEKNQRAISMAQQTKRGHVYVISNIGSFGDDVFKIGMTRRLEPEERIRELGDASVPFTFDIHAMIFSEDAPKLEKELHQTFFEKQMNKINPRKEFFRVGIKDIKTKLDELEIDTKWTMVAEAREYRESILMDSSRLVYDDSNEDDFEDFEADQENEEEVEVEVETATE